MTSADNNRELPFHRRVRPAKDWHQLFSRYGSELELPEEHSERFNSAVDHLLHRFQSDTLTQLDLPNRFSRPLTIGCEPDVQLWDHISDCVFSIDSDGCLIYANHAALDLAEAFSETHSLLSSNSGPSLRLPLRTLLRQLNDPKSVLDWLKSEQCDQPCLIETRDGRRWEVQLIVSTAGCRQRLNVLLKPMVLRSDSRVAKHAQYDILTGLPNRFTLMQELRTRVKAYRPKAPSSCIYYFDLDGFKFVNDSLGHHAGDQLLCEVSRRLQKILTDDQTLYRLGGDEFVILGDDISNLHDVPRFAEELVQEFVRPFALSGKNAYLGVSVGIAILNDLTRSPEQWVQQSDLAMYEAKDSGGNTYAFYNVDVEMEIQRRYRLRSNIREALDKREFEVFYQPKYCLRTRTLCGAEALVRWHRNGKVQHSPGEFIPEAETCGLIIPISRVVFEKVAQDINSWIERGLPPLLTSVNISACHFRMDLMEDLITGFLAEGVPANRIELEITESSFMNDLHRAKEKIQELQRLGFTISIDDFGTGYSSLNYLKELPADIIKIDQTFISQLPGPEFESTLVKSVIQIAQAQGLKVLAEGVESQQCADLLAEYGCDGLQGYWFGKPMPREAFEAEFLLPSVKT